MVVLLSILSVQAADLPALAGTVEFVTGKAWFLDAAGKRRPAVRGERLRSSDTVLTGADGEVHLDMDDGGYLAVRPNTQIKVEQYRARGDKDDRVFLNLLKGTFRSFTGWVPKVAPDNYQVRTLTATIGVRGTDHEPLFLPEGSGIGEAGTYDKVNEGATIIDHASGRVDVMPNTAGFAPLSPEGKARLLERIPEFFQPTPNEGLLEGRHQKVQEKLKEKLESRQRLNRSQTREGEPNSNAASEMQETPTDGAPGLKEAPASTLPPIAPAVPAAGAGGGAAAAIPSAAAPAAATSFSPAVPAVPNVAAPAAAAAASVPVPSPASAIPAVPVGTSNSSSVPAAVAAPAAKSLSAPDAVAPATSAAKPAAAPASTDRRPAAGRPRGVQDQERPAAADSQPAKAATPAPATSDRERVYNDRRKKQQQDREGLYESDRNSDRDRDLDKERNAERDAIRRSREQR